MRTMSSPAGASIGFAAPWSLADPGEAHPYFLHHPEALKALGAQAEERNQLFVEDDRPQVDLVAPFGRWGSARQGAPTREETIAVLRERAYGLADRGFKVTLVVASDGRARIWFSEKPVRILAIEARYASRVRTLAGEFELIAGHEGRAKERGARRGSAWMESYGADAAYFVQMRQQFRKLVWTAADLRRTFGPLLTFRTSYEGSDLACAYGEDAKLLAETVGKLATPAWDEAQRVSGGRRVGPAEKAARHIGAKLRWSEEQVDAFKKDYENLTGRVGVWKELEKLMPRAASRADEAALGKALLLRRWNGSDPQPDYQSIAFNRHVWIPGASDRYPDAHEAPLWSSVRRMLVRGEVSSSEKEQVGDGLNLLPAALIVVRDSEMLAWAQGMGAWAGARFYVGDPLAKPQAFDESVARMMMAGQAAAPKAQQ
jgi:hypothetical protein